MRASDYAFATAKIRVLENALLSSNDIMRMVEAPTAQKAFSVLNDMDYANELAGLSFQDYRKALDNTLAHVHADLNAITPDPLLVTLVFLRYDFHNMKVLFKAKYAPKKYQDILSPIGSLKIADLEKSIIAQQKANFPDYIEEILHKAKSSFDQDNSPMHIDNFLDTQYFALLLKLAHKVGNPFIIEFARLKIDLNNMRILFRAPYLDLNKVWFSKFFIKGGHIPFEVFMNNFEQKDTRAFIQGLQQYNKHITPDRCTAFIETKKLREFDKTIERIELRYVEQVKHITFGPEIILYYLYLKKNAIRNIRMIMTGKITGLATDEIRKNLVLPH